MQMQHRETAARGVFMGFPGDSPNNLIEYRLRKGPISTRIENGSGKGFWPPPGGLSIPAFLPHRHSRPNRSRPEQIGQLGQQSV